MICVFRNNVLNEVWFCNTYFSFLRLELKIGAKSFNTKRVDRDKMFGVKEEKEVGSVIVNKDSVV